MERDDEAKEQGDDRWLVVDTGFGRYLGKLLGFRDPDGDEPVGEEAALTGKPELALGHVVRFEMVNLPTRQGIAVQAVPSSPIPWVPLFARESRITLPLDRILWYSDIDEAAVVEMRKELLAAAGGPRAV